MKAVTFLLCLCSVNSYSEIKRDAREFTSDLDLPLILTPLIEEGKIEEARIAANVSLDGFENVTSYAGYLTVNEAFNSNMFFWYFPAQTNPETAPVLLWLEGGPGMSSLVAFFGAHGPFALKNGDELELREYTWTTNHHVIYIDNPVGAGFSFTDDGGYAQNETQAGNDLYNALVQFFQLFPELQQNELYPVGQSYGCKFATAVSYAIYKSNPSAKVKINLQGLAIGNGLCDPERQLKHSDHLYQIGLIDWNTKEIAQNLEQQLVNYIQNEQWLEAYAVFKILIDADTPSLYKNVTAFDNYYNILRANNAVYEDIRKIMIYVQRDDIRAAIHVGNSAFEGQDPKIVTYLAEDFMQSIAPWISELLNNYRVLTYHGQLDIIVPYQPTVNYLENLNFDAVDEYRRAERHQWWVDEDIAGYVKQAGNLTEVLLRNAGHLAPQDQPKWGFDLITRFTYRKPFF